MRQLEPARGVEPNLFAQFARGGRARHLALLAASCRKLPTVVAGTEAVLPHQIREALGVDGQDTKAGLAEMHDPVIALLIGWIANAMLDDREPAVLVDFPR